MTNITEFDSDSFYLGRLCKYGHDWNSTGKSRRRKNTRICTQCQAQNSLKYYYKNREKELERLAEHYQRNREAVRQRHKKYYQKNKKNCFRRQLEYRKTPQGKEMWRRYMTKFRQTSKGRVAVKRANSRRRAYKRSNHHAPYTLEQIQALKKKFDNACAYCGSTDTLVLDHFLPVSIGGPDCLGNFVPACHKCNNYKRDYDPMLWYKSQPFYSPERWKLILEVLGKTESNYNQLPLL